MAHRTNTHRLALASIASLAWAWPALAADPPVSTTVTAIAEDYSWGYRCAVKQPLGSYSLGRSVYNISRVTDTESYHGSPDYLIWVDEHSGDAAILEHPVGVPTAPVINPGGLAGFDADGDIWFVLGGRANDLPFDLARSQSPYEPADLRTLLDDFVSDQGSTVPCFHALGGDGLLAYRHGGSSWFGSVAVVVQRYDITGDVPTLLEEFSLASGSLDDEHGKIGIEQLWTRHDPRMNATAATWQWWQVDERWFGSNPFVYTYDGGVTWQTVDGAVLEPPVVYADRTPQMVPFDHVALQADAEWHPRDLGWGPHGAPWMTLPDGEHNAVFWRWDGQEWQGRVFAGPVLGKAKPYACGATRDYLVIAYAEAADPGRLYAITSADDGETWSEPVLIDAAPDGDSISWVAFVQPAERYLDNAARFFYGYFKGNLRAQNYRNSVRFAKLQVGPRSDFNADGAVDSTDVLAFLNAWTGQHWTSDFNDDGGVNTADVLAFLNAFAQEQ